MSEDKPGFLSRWSRRKLDAQHELPLAEPASTAPTPAATTSSPVATDTAEPLPAGTEPVAPPTAPGSSEPKPLPTLDDVAALTADSDFSIFVGKGVTPEVKNAAMKKLFSDPHYNIMDGLDIYIDDYSQPEVMPPSMLRKMVGARVLNLFTDEDEAKAVAEDERLAALAAPADPASPGAAPDNGPAGSVLESVDSLDQSAQRDLLLRSNKTR